MNTGYLLMDTSKKLKYELNQTLLEEGITVQQWAVIQQIDLREAVTASDLAQYLDMDKPTASGIIQRLEKKNLLSRKNNPSDKRSSLLFLTPLGKKRLEKWKRLSDRVVDIRLEVLSEEEKKILNQLLTKLSIGKRI